MIFNEGDLMLMIGAEGCEHLRSRLEAYLQADEARWQQHTRPPLISYRRRMAQDLIRRIDNHLTAAQRLGLVEAAGEEYE